MATITPLDLTGRRVLVPGGSGGVGEGVVRAFLMAGAEVVVPSRTAAREQELHQLLGEVGPGRLHTSTHDYTTFTGAEALAATMQDRLGGIDDVVAPIGGWWAGGPLGQIKESDWSEAFVDLATTHMAVARAALPRMTDGGSYSIVVGQSAEFPVPGSGLVSMQQAALLMMQRVLAAEQPQLRIAALVLGPVRTRFTVGEPNWVSADQIGAVAVAAAASPTLASGSVRLGSSEEAEVAVRRLT